MEHLYRYEPIRHPAYLHTTRILSLEPGKPSDVLSGSLTEMNVIHPEPFEALSYVWGRNRDKETILCDGRPLQITRSLSIALRRLRDPANNRQVWVDQVCINQLDQVERSQQVRHMNSIYKKASKVVIWLGEDPGNHADKAFALLKSLAAISQDVLLLESFRAKQAEGQLDWYPSEYWLSLGELFRQPWVSSKFVLSITWMMISVMFRS
jgi:hypothetical protein